jgi:hypothetical protein
MQIDPDPAYHFDVDPDPDHCGITAHHAFLGKKIPYIINFPDAVLSPGFPSTPGDEPESLSAAEQRLFHLQRQLDIETKAGHPLLNMYRLFFTLIMDL